MRRGYDKGLNKLAELCNKLDLDYQVFFDSVSERHTLLIHGKDGARDDIYLMDEFVVPHGVDELDFVEQRMCEYVKNKYGDRAVTNKPRLLVLTYPISSQFSYERSVEGYTKMAELIFGKEFNPVYVEAENTTPEQLINYTSNVLHLLKDEDIYVIGHWDYDNLASNTVRSFVDCTAKFGSYNTYLVGMDRAMHYNFNN